MDSIVCRSSVKPKAPDRRLRAIAICASVLVCGGSGLWAADTLAGSAPAERREDRVAWWQAARFGIFVHWGLYSILGRGEWAQWNERIPNEEYARLAEQFRPSRFDPSEWAALFKAAGAQYAVFTSRHHDGFALFDDPGSGFTSVRTAAHRDFVAEYVKAMRAAGLRVGLYYSPLDWRFPGFLLPDTQLASAEAMRAQYQRQLDELLSNYGRIDVLWFDGGEADWLGFGGDWKGAEWVKRPRGEHYHGRFNWQHDRAYARLRQLQPQVLINGRADMPEDFFSREGDRALGDFDDAHPWELCTPIVDGPWGFAPNAPVKPLERLIRTLVQAAGRDGNFLLNVGPRPDGRIDPPQVVRLREIGEWLGRNGESIYGTRGGPFLPGSYGVSTRRGSAIYVHVLNWPAGLLRLPALPARVLRASRIGGGKLEFSQDGPGLGLSVPSDARDPIDTVVKLELDRPAEPLPLAAISPGDAPQQQPAELNKMPLGGI